MEARWLFGLVFLGYLFGPGRPPETPPPSAATAAMSALYSESGVPRDDVVRWTARLVGAGLTAAAVALTFLTLRRIAAPEGAWVLTLMAAFASPLWSWTSRSSSSEATLVLVVAAVLWLSVGRLGAGPAVVAATVGAVATLVL